ncbi:MAG TPA: response regulator transcription factor [Armatimonadota bacterium]|jgi:DNA-binding response OmpR family regulator
MSQRVLIADDDEALSEAVGWYLEAEGFVVARAGDGTAALASLQADGADALIVDVMMPGMDGFQLCQAVRRISNVPVLMLSARDGEADKVRALGLGADDYVTKPFGAMELVARIKALLRRAGSRLEPALIAAGLRVLPEQRQATVNDNPVDLSALEFDLLAALMERPQRVLSREQLAGIVWDSFYGDDRLVDSHIYRLRKKLIAAGLDPCPIITVRGVGYAFRPEA